MLIFSDKFILSVSIIADIEQCPETPPPELSEQNICRTSSEYQQLSSKQNRNSNHNNVYRAVVPTNV